MWERKISKGGIEEDAIGEEESRLERENNTIQMKGPIVKVYHSINNEKDIKTNEVDNMKEVVSKKEEEDFLVSVSSITSMLVIRDFLSFHKEFIQDSREAIKLCKKIKKLLDHLLITKNLNLESHCCSREYCWIHQIKVKN